MALWGHAGLARGHSGHPCRTSRSMLPNWSISLNHGQRKPQPQRYQWAPIGQGDLRGGRKPVCSCGDPQHALSPLPYVMDGHQKPGGSVEMIMGSAHIWFGSVPGLCLVPCVHKFMKVRPLPGCPHPSCPLCRKPLMGRRWWWCWTPRGAMPSTLASLCCHPSI